jgi:O-antigen chain-terminating methyltransferase
VKAALRDVEGPLVHLREHGDVITDDLRIIHLHLPGQGRVLDIGAGRGWFVTAARRQGMEALGLDIEAQAANVWSREGIPGVIGDGFRTPFTASSFDVVRMKEVIEHVERPLALVQEAHRVLKAGGLLIAHVPSPYSQFYPVANFWDDYTHVRPISRFGLTRLVADAGLELDRIEGYMSGRNAAERALGKVLARVLPHMYRVIARSPAM